MNNLSRLGLTAVLIITPALNAFAAKKKYGNEDYRIFYLTPEMLGDKIKLAEKNRVILNKTIAHRHGKFAAAGVDEEGCEKEVAPDLIPLLKQLDFRYLHSVVRLGKAKSSTGQELTVVLDYLVQEGEDMPSGPKNDSPQLQYVVYLSQSGVEFKIEEIVEINSGSFNPLHLNEKIENDEKEKYCADKRELHRSIDESASIGTVWNGTAQIR